MSKEGPVGHTLIEVDDLASQENNQHQENMSTLKKIFNLENGKASTKTKVIMPADLLFSE